MPIETAAETSSINVSFINNTGPILEHSTYCWEYPYWPLQNVIAILPIVTKNPIGEYGATSITSELSAKVVRVLRVLKIVSNDLSGVPTAQYSVDEDIKKANNSNGGTHTCFMLTSIKGKVADYHHLAKISHDLRGLSVMLLVALKNNTEEKKMPSI